VEAGSAFHDAWELARARDDTLTLLDVLNGEVETELTAETETILVQELESARSIADESSAFLLNRIALAQEKMGAGTMPSPPRSPGGHECDAKRLDTRERVVRIAAKKAV
jgi:hypothetical protein